MLLQSKGFIIGIGVCTYMGETGGIKIERLKLEYYGNIVIYISLKH